MAEDHGTWTDQSPVSMYEIVNEQNKDCFQTSFYSWGMCFMVFMCGCEAVYTHKQQNRMIPSLLFFIDISLLQGLLLNRKATFGIVAGVKFSESF